MIRRTRAIYILRASPGFDNKKKIESQDRFGILRGKKKQKENAGIELTRYFFRHVWP